MDITGLGGPPTKPRSIVLITGAATGIARLDVVVHNAGHLGVGYTEAFTAEEVAHLVTAYEVSQFGIETTIVNAAARKAQEEYLSRMGFGDLLTIKS